jgi:hypothetical protein
MVGNCVARRRLWRVEQGPVGWMACRRQDGDDEVARLGLDDGASPDAVRRKPEVLMRAGRA